MKLIYPLIAVLLLASGAYLGAAAGLEYLFGGDYPIRVRAVILIRLQLEDLWLGKITGAFPYSYHLRTSEVTGMD